MADSVATAAAAPAASNRTRYELRKELVTQLFSRLIQLQQQVDTLGQLLCTWLHTTIRTTRAKKNWHSWNQSIFICCCTVGDNLYA